MTGTNLMPTGAIETFTGSNGATPNSTNISAATLNEGSGGGLTIQGNQMRMRTGTASGNRISTRINRANLADGEMVFDWVYPAAGNNFPSLSIRADTLLNGDGGYWIDLNNTMDVGKFVPNYSYQNLGTHAYSFSTSDIVRTRIALFGSRLRMRSWLASGSEVTSSWHIDVTDTGTQPITGKWGWSTSSGSAGSKDFFVDNVDLYDTITPSQATINPTGTITATGALNKRTSKILAGSITATGALTKLKVVAKLFTGSITATGALTKRTSKAFASSITATGVLAKRMPKLFTGSVTTTGALRKTTSRKFAGSITATGAFATTFLGRVFGYPGIVIARISKAGGLRARFRRG